MPVHGPRFLTYRNAAVGAAATVNVYFPLSDQANVGTTATVVGIHSEALLEYLKFGTDSSLAGIEILGIWCRDRTGYEQPIMFPRGVGQGFHFGNTNTVAEIINMRTWVEDCASIHVQIRNSNGSSAKTCDIILGYTPLKRDGSMA